MHTLALLFYETFFIVMLAAHEKCPPITGHTIHALCTYEGKEFPCRTYVKPGTKAKIKCAFMYEKSEKSSYDEDYLYCRNDGDWNKLPFECEQMCGTVGSKVPFSVNSQITDVHKVPWQVAIYSKNSERKFQHICGGTLIKSKMVISAAHCFWNSLTSRLHDKSNYIIVAGKFYRDYYANNETEAIQKSEISNIQIPAQFSGVNYDYVSDIAILSLERHILFKNHIRPACLPWTINRNDFNLNNKSGVVGGWGTTNTALYSTELRSVKLVSIDGNSCKRRITQNNKIPNDKFCVETREGKNVCPGDSGGGFVIPIDADGTTHYHLWGIVSNGMIDWKNPVTQCDSNFVTTFTNVQLYETLIKASIAFQKEKEHISNCFVPKKGEIRLKNSKTNTELKRGTYVEVLTNVTYICPEPFVLDGKHTTNSCNGDWINPHPKCSKTCTSIIDQYTSHTFNAYCYYKGVQVSCDGNLKPETRAYIRCAFMYKESSGNANIFCKSDGNWDKVPLSCKQICGTNDLKQPILVPIKRTAATENPWHVAIYLINRNGKYNYICGGTLISSQVVISAASCFWNPEKSTLNYESNYTVALGKLYRDYYATNETKEVQKSNISKIKISNKFIGAINDYYAFDVALLTLTNHIIYKNHIRPACIADDYENEIQSNQTGVVAGWHLTSTGIYTTELHSVNLLSINHASCNTTILDKSKVVTEKFCGKTKGERELCAGDNGSGFLVPKDINGVTSYYIWGVVSNDVKIQKDHKIECNSNLRITFNSIDQEFKTRIIDSYIFVTNNCQVGSNNQFWEKGDEIYKISFDSFVSVICLVYENVE